MVVWRNWDALLHPFVVIGNDGVHSRLLEHYFGHPYLDRSEPSVCWQELCSIASTDLVRALAPRFRAQGRIEWFSPGHAPHVMDLGKPHFQRIVDQLRSLLCQYMPSCGVVA